MRSTDGLLYAYHQHNASPTDPEDEPAIAVQIQHRNLFGQNPWMAFRYRRIPVPSLIVRVTVAALADEFVSQLRTPTIYNAIQDAERLSGASSFRFPESILILQVAL